MPIYCGGHSDAALRRAARYCDGWIGRSYAWDEAAHYVAKLKRFLDEFGRGHGSFEIILGLYGEPGVDLYRRAEEKLGGEAGQAAPGRHCQAKLEQRRGGVAKPGRQRVDGLPGPVTVVDALHDDGQFQAGERQADRQAVILSSNPGDVCRGWRCAGESVGVTRRRGR